MHVILVKLLLFSSLAKNSSLRPAQGGHEMLRRRHVAPPTSISQRRLAEAAEAWAATGAAARGVAPAWEALPLSFPAPPPQPLSLPPFHVPQPPWAASKEEVLPPSFGAAEVAKAVAAVLAPAAGTAATSVAEAGVVAVAGVEKRPPSPVQSS